MATRTFENDRADVQLTSSDEDVETFTVPGGETWLIQRYSARITQEANTQTEVELHLRRSGEAAGDDEIVFDYGDNPVVETINQNIALLQGKILKPGDGIVFRSAVLTTGTITLNSHIYYLKIT